MTTPNDLDKLGLKNIKKINELIQTDEMLKIKIEELKNKITKKEKNEI